LEHSPYKADSQKYLYGCQNRAIHKGRNELNMSLDDCRELARQIGGKPSISSLSLEQRWELIEELKSKGARVFNPPLSGPVFRKGQHEISPVSPKGLYSAHLDYWNRKFPRPRPDFASNQQLALIQTFWELDFDDGRPGHGLRGFLFRQTRHLKDGPVSDLVFLKAHHVMAVLMPLKKKAEWKKDGRNEA
jgi:hypothetical protein